MMLAPMLSRVVVLNDASVARGGATGLALAAIRGLRGRGVPVTLITGDAGADPALAALGVDVVAAGDQRLAERRGGWAAGRGLYHPAARRLVGRWIAAHDTPRTVYHVHGWAQILSPSIFAALRPVARRTILHAHDFFLACPNGAFMDFRRHTACERVPLGASCLATHCDKRSYAHKLWRVGRQAVLRRALARPPWAAILMIHERMAPYLERAGHPPARLRTLRNPAAPLAGGRIRAEDNQTFFYVGRVAREKGVEDALAAAARARVPLEVIGDGPLRALLQRRYPATPFHGWCPPPVLAQRLARARAVLMPTHYPEPFGLVAAEAALSGLPVVVSASALLADELVAHGIGWACAPRDVDALAGALAALRDMPRDALRRRSEAGRAAGPSLAMPAARWLDELLAIYAAAVTSAGAA